MVKFGRWELVVEWDTGDKDIYPYHTEQAARAAGEMLKMALGGQVAWCGVREVK